MNPSIISRTVTGPGLKARPAMATYITRAKASQSEQRWARERTEALHLMAQNGFEPQPPAPEMPAKLALHQEQQPDPEFSPAYLNLLIGVALGATAAFLFGGRS